MILIIDNYDSFTYNLVHLVAAHTDQIAVHRNDRITMSEIFDLNPDGILISPGPGRPQDAGITLEIIRSISPETPTLGVCLGHQAIGEAFGGRITYAPSLMHGKTSRIAHDGHTIFRDVPQNFTATRYHSLVVVEDDLPGCLEISARSDDGVIQGIRHRDFPVEGIQFHPESLLTLEGPKLIENWMHRLSLAVA